MNGDAEANNITVTGVSFFPQTSELVVALSGNGNGAFRINYTVILVD